MTTAIETLPASTDHASPWPPIGAPCCGNNAGLFREPVPPPSMLLGLRGMVVTYPTAMQPALRGCNCNGNGVMGSPMNNGVLRGLGSLPPATVTEASSILGEWAGRFGFTLPPTPLDVLDAAYRLAQTERQLELLRTKLRSTRAAGIPLTANDLNNYKNAADIYYAAARAVYDPIVNAIRSVNATAASLIPAVPRPLGIDDPGGAVPYVPTEAEYTKIRSGDMTGLTGPFNDMVEEVRRRLAGRSTSRSPLSNELGTGTIILIIVGIIAAAAVVIALVVGATAVVNTINAWVVTKNAEEVARRRLEVYNTCLSSGTGTTECARQARTVVEMPPPPPPAAPSPFDFGGGLGGGLLLGLVAAGAAYYFLATPGGRARAGLTGMHRPRSRSRRRRG